MSPECPEGPLPDQLPPPDAGARAHSARVCELICSEAARHGGSLPFWRFMELALYAPGLGYYSAGSRKFGESGDFVTAPELSPLFSRCVARQCAEVLGKIGGDVLEFGAGTGAMAVEALLELERFRQLPDRYLILDVSPELQSRQRERLQKDAPHLLSRVHWISGLPSSFRGVMLANEVLDAMPVHRFRRDPDGVSELAVACTGEGMRWGTIPAGERLRMRVEALERGAGFAAPYESEINFAALDWLRAVADSMTCGLLLLIDYGFPQREFYHPQRDTGTLMCHYRHRSHGDPLVLVGLQDITSHVDFTAMAEAAVSSGLHVAGYTSQAGFLLSLGLLDMVPALTDSRARLDMTTQIKRLTLPTEMGELFKVMALTREYEEKLSGFELRDDRIRL